MAPTNLKMALSTLVKVFLFVCLGGLVISRSIFLKGDFDSSGVRTGLGHLEVSKRKEHPMSLNHHHYCLHKIKVQVFQLPSGATYDGTFSKGLPNGIGVQPIKYRYRIKICIFA